VTHVYSDLDGTLFAPGGKLLTNDAGQPSTELAAALVALKQAGIELVIVTGRAAEQGFELRRLLNANSFIGEMGVYCEEGFGLELRSSWNLGHWQQLELAPGLAPGVLPPGVTPSQLIEQQGSAQRLIASFPGRLEPYQSSRGATLQALQGCIDAQAAAAFLANERLPLQLMNNGRIHPLVHHLDVVPDEPIHIYRLIPAGVNKGAAVAAHMAAHGLAPAQCLAVGDSLGDLSMAEVCGSFVAVRNALRSEAVAAALLAGSDAGQRIFLTKGSTADGWVELARALLAAR